MEIWYIKFNGKIWSQNKNQNSVKTLGPKIWSKDMVPKFGSKTWSKDLPKICWKTQLENSVQTDLQRFGWKPWPGDLEQRFGNRYWFSGSPRYRFYIFFECSNVSTKSLDHPFRPCTFRAWSAARPKKNSLASECGAFRRTPKQANLQTKSSDQIFRPSL